MGEVAAKWRIGGKNSVLNNKKLFCLVKIKSWFRLSSSWIVIFWHLWEVWEWCVIEREKGNKRLRNVFPSTVVGRSRGATIGGGVGCWCQCLSIPGQFWHGCREAPRRRRLGAHPEEEDYPRLHQLHLCHRVVAHRHALHEPD